MWCHSSEKEYRNDFGKTIVLNDVKNAVPKIFNAGIQ